MKDDEVDYNDTSFDEVTMRVAIGCLMGMVLGLVAAITFRMLLGWVLE